MNDKKRPPFWRPFKRATYDAMEKSYNEIQARILPADEAAIYDTELPAQWRQEPIRWILSGLGIKKPPVGSGAGYTQSPFSEVYTRVYGVTRRAKI